MLQAPLYLQTSRRYTNVLLLLLLLLLYYYYYYYIIIIIIIIIISLLLLILTCSQSQTLTMGTRTATASNAIKSNQPTQVKATPLA